MKKRKRPDDGTEKYIHDILTPALEKAAIARGSKFILVEGSLLRGFLFTGPYDTYEDAADDAHDIFEVLELNKVLIKGRAA